MEEFLATRVVIGANPGKAQGGRGVQFPSGSFFPLNFDFTP